MSRWYQRFMGGETAEPPKPRCPHCRRELDVCAACSGAYDPGRLCQECMSGLVCPSCRRHWTWN
jgi:hypothetical protein